MGLILGTIRLPALIQILRVDPRAAAGTNLFIGFVMGSMGWLGHLAGGQVDYPLAVLMGSGAMAGSYLGARQAGRVSLDSLLMVMGAVLTVVGTLSSLAGGRHLRAASTPRSFRSWPAVGPRHPRPALSSRTRLGGP